jgi:hypothetical protein
VGKPHTVYEQKKILHKNGTESVEGVGSSSCSCDQDNDHTKIVEVDNRR